MQRDRDCSMTASVATPEADRPATWTETRAEASRRRLLSVALTLPSAKWSWLETVVCSSGLVPTHVATRRIVTGLPSPSVPERFVVTEARVRRGLRGIPA